MNYDVIIIGAGMAGSTCGYLLKKKGKNVLIVEKEDITKKDKLCGGLLTKKSYDLFSEIYEFNNELKFKHVDRFVIKNSGKDIFLDNDFYSIYRKDIDDYVLNKYINEGGKIIDNVKSYDLDLDNNTLTICGKVYTFEYLVGADGVYSNLRKIITGRTQRRNFAYEVTGKKSNDLEIYFFDKFYGYGWVIPNEKNSVIGIGSVAQNSKIDAQLDEFLNSINVKKNRLRGAFLPTGDDIFLNYKNVYFIGDSAGLISPILGEGIYYALLSAKILSESIGHDYKAQCSSMLTVIKKERIMKKYIYIDSTRNYVFNNHNKPLIKKAINHFKRKHV